jgi:Fe-S cluster assembly protein SufD
MLITGWPTKKNELWKYTSLKSLEDKDWSIVTDSTEGLLNHDQLNHVKDLLRSDMTNFVFIDGNLNQTLSDTNSMMVQTSVTKLNFKGSDLALKDLFQKTIAKEIQLTVTRESNVEKPVHMLFVSTASGRQSRLVNHQLRIDLKSQVQLKIVTQSVSLTPDGQTLNMFNVNVHLEAGAHCEWLQIQNLNFNSFNLSQNSIHLDRDANFNFADLTLGAQLSRTNTETFFESENANAGVYSCAALNQTQHSDLYSSINHLKGHNQSYQVAKSILNDSSQSVFRGRVFIAKDSQKANSEQLNNNLLLSRTAKANSIPQLEIYADDVKAGHGSTVGQMNPDEIFYFLSRGISEAKAVRMIAEGFAKEVVFKLKSVELQDLAKSVLQSKLDRMV